MIREIYNMDKNQTLYFDAQTPYEAMRKLIYYLKQRNALVSDFVIHKTESNRFLYLIHNGETYATKLETSYYEEDK